jgi:Sir2- and TIR-associating SLOG family
MRQKVGIEEALVLRPFPQTGDPTQLATMWREYRQEIISHAGIALFLFGNKNVDGVAVVADGLFDEFEIARTQGAAVIPVGATGSAAKELADKVSAEPNQFVPELDADGRAMLGAIAASTADLDSLIDPVMELIHKLQGKG